MMRDPRRVVLLVLTIALAVGCGYGTTPSAPLTGTWNGTLTDSVAGAGTFASTITESGSSLSGMYTDTFPNLPSANNSGTVSGTVNGSNVTLTTTPSSSLICGVTETGTLNAANTQVSGTYASLTSCTATHTTGSFSGTITAASSGSGS
jgi:hypothetical protein